MAAVRRQLVVVSLGEEDYAFPAADVREIIGAIAPRAVASPDPAVRGIISLRGRFVGVVDLATRLGVAGGAGDADTVVILEAPDGARGVVVDDVAGVVTVDEAQIAGDVVHLGDRTIALLDRSVAA